MNNVGVIRMKEIVSFASVLFIVAFCCSLVACTDVTGKITDTINELADTQSNYLETREIKL